MTGAVKSFGEPSGEASWIVQSDGSVNGSVTGSGLSGGGNCSTWNKIKQLLFGVDCNFFQTAKK